MGRWRLLAAVLGCALCASRASAQDMVFTTDETGGALDPGAAARSDAPPSEGLANGLRLYQRERWAEAAVQLERVVSGATEDSPAGVQRAQFFLAKSLFHLGFHRASLGVFDELTSAPTHAHFAAALPWLAQLARELPEPAGVAELVGRYPAEQIDTLDAPATAEAYEQLMYLSARHAYQRAELETASRRFARVPERSPLYVQARLHDGVTQVRLRRARPAIAAFREALAALDQHGDRYPDAARMRDLAWLSLGRVYYTAANRTEADGSRVVDGPLLASAARAWDQVDPASEHWLDALFEQSWALFLGNEEARAMGNIHALFSPYFPDAYYPEALVLKAVVFFSACQLGNAEAMIAQFHDRYDPVRAELESTLGGFADHQQTFEFLRRVRDGDAVVSERLRGAVHAALSDRSLLRHLEYVGALDAEQARLERADHAFVSSSLGDRIRQDVLVSRSFAVDRAGELAAERTRRLLDELDELMNQIDTVEIELLRVRREGLSAPHASAPPPLAGGNVEVDEEHQIWPFTGEYWRDELPFYRQQVSSICTR